MTTEPVDTLLGCKEVEGKLRLIEIVASTT